MDAPLLVLIKSDPQKSHRPVEAIRMGLGFVGGELPVEFLLLNNAPHLLGLDSEDLVDGEILQKYLPPLGEMGTVFHVEASALDKIDLSESDYKIKAVSPDEITRLVENAGRHIIM
ncbi:MAG TPA: hypothetical protein VLB09_01495 [Nitrospiria bacterium]|nr:hypothetical protein [Nitrospiria bacterium]